MANEQNRPQQQPQTSSDTKPQQPDARLASAVAREAAREAGKVPTKIRIKHGQYIDHVRFDHGDEDKPAAIVGDVITVPKREADRLERDGVAEVLAG